MNDYSGDDEDYDLNTAPHQPAPNVTATVDSQVALRTAVERGRRDIASTIVSAERNFSYQTKSYKEQIESEVRTAVRSAQFYESVYQTGRHIVNMQPTVIKSFDERQSAPHHQLSGLLKFTPDGLLCYVNSVRRAIMGVNVQTGEEFPLVETPTTVYCLAIEGEYIAVGGSARCQIWRLSPHGPAKLVHELTGLVTIVNSVCFYRYNGQLRLIVNHNEPRESMMVYSVDTGKELFRKTVPEPQGTRINYCAIHPDGQLVLVGGDLHALFLLRTAADTFTIIQRLASPVGDVHMCAWSPDGRFGAGASDGRFAPATDPRVGSDVCLVERVAEEIRSVPVPDIAGTQPPVRNVCFSPSGLVAFVHGNTQVRVMRPDHPEYSDVFTPAAPTHGYLSLLGATWDQHDTLYVCTGEAIFAYTAYTIPTLIDLCVHTLRSRPNRWRHLVLPAEVAERLTAEAPWESNKRRQLERILRSAQRNREGAQRDHERLYERSVQRYQEAARAAEAAGVELSKEPLPPPYTYPPFISDEVLAAPPPS